MADVVNLRQRRKLKERTEKEAMAEANRQKFGRSKAEKQLQSVEAERARQKLDGHRRDET